MKQRVSDFLTDLADPAYHEIGDRFSFRHSDDFDWGGVVVGAKDKGGFGLFDVSDGASVVFPDSVHIQFALAIRLK